MIPILFSADSTSFTTNGIGRLSDAISCVVHEARNGEFELEMTYPVDGTHYSDIVHSAIIVAQPSARRDNQAFRIYKITKPFSGKITVYAQHISYQLSWIPVAPMTATNLTNALAYMMSGAVEDCPFTLSADFTSDADFAIALPSSIRSYMGGRTGSILDIYGGEWLFDNYECTLMESRGEDNGYTIRYGKNLTTLTQEENILNTYTGVYPYCGIEGTTVTLSENVVYADTAENFPFQRPLIIDFSDKFDGLPTEDELREYTESYIEANDIGVPAVNLQIDFVNLPDTEEYKDLLAGVENLDLCDTVTVEFTKLDISTESKVVEIWWDVLRDRYEKIEVGNSRSTLSSTIETTIATASAAATASQVSQQIDRATGVLNAGTRGHIILNRNEDGWANELLALDDDNIASATQVLRINMNGIGFSSDGYDGTYYQAWTMDGTLSLGGTNNSYGNLVILDADGNTIGTWNKDGIYANGGELVIGDNFAVDTEGNLTATNGTFSGDITGGTITIGDNFAVDSDGNMTATNGTFTGDISGSAITGSTFGTTDDEFYVILNETEDGTVAEVGLSGFTAYDNMIYSNTIGSVTNAATDGAGDYVAAINAETGEAGFTDVYLVNSTWNGASLTSLLSNLNSAVSAYVASHDEDEDEEPDTTSTGATTTGEEAYLEDGAVLDG